MNGTRPPADIAALLAEARAQLDDPREALLLVAHALGLARETLYAHPERAVSRTEVRAALALVEARKRGTPIAYLTGQREFYGLALAVTPAVLIPRPETELLVDLALAHLNTPAVNRFLSPSPSMGEGGGEGDQNSAALRRNPSSPPSPTRGEGAGKGAAPVVADLGTGSGAIAIAIAHARPDAQLIATDRSPAALALATANARALGLAINFFCADWLTAFAPRTFDLIVSNPPYVAAGDVHLAQGDLRFEPNGALVADDDGLADLRDLIGNAPACLKPGGMLVLEHGAEQQTAVCALLAEHGYAGIETHRDLAGLPRAVTARHPL
ncbi:MAG: HemK/PrmC family methyltransferase [Gammaproteobacteria bacterium]